jgi:hypothetical protein
MAERNHKNHSQAKWGLARTRIQARCNYYKIISVHVIEFFLQLNTFISHLLTFTFLWCVCAKPGGDVMNYFEFGVNQIT